jgi:hypothetical protein
MPVIDPMGLAACSDRARGTGFFTIDRRTWKLLCGLEDINLVVAYLTIAAGTGKGNRISKWSAVAIQNYTGLAWKRGKPAIARLIGEGFISVRSHRQRRVPYMSCCRSILS